MKQVNDTPTPSCHAVDGVVIGTLLGNVTGNAVTVTSAFPLPHSYVQDTVWLGAVQ